MVFKIKRQWKIAFFRLVFFGQFGFKFFIPSQEDRVELDRCFELIFKGLILLHLLYRNLQELILVLPMLNHRLHQRRVKFMLGKSSKGEFR
jgi:hypothetical protein